MNLFRLVVLFCQDHVTNVFWNLEEYPIPDGADPNLIRDNIEGALVEIGFLGYKQFHGHGDTLHHERDEMREARIFAYQGIGIGIGGVKMSPDFKIPLEMISWAGSAGDDPVKFLVIAKQKPGSELLRVLECLKSRKCTLLVLVDDTAKGESLFGSEESVLECIQVFGGAKPMRKGPPFYDSDYDSDTDPYFSVAGVTPTKSSCDSDDGGSSQFDIFKMEDFSEPIRAAKGDKTAVFWDVEDCPFPPLCSHPDEVYGRIEEALRERGCLGEISIWAYVDEKKGSWSGEQHLLRNKTWDSRIYFLPGGENSKETLLFLLYMCVCMLNLT
ncbi:unnamed protein product [Thlaspi arvense]|uniref:NYN domain-containing protein n=1 Tax=Thlaspi arvense TaxID=13288 RepID=A0AAU9T0I9_THLAR|nr:unnamed protein product [Thlaspi arvense]